MIQGWQNASLFLAKKDRFIALSKARTRDAILDWTLHLTVARLFKLHPQSAKPTRLLGGPAREGAGDTAEELSVLPNIHNPFGGVRASHFDRWARGRGRKLDALGKPERTRVKDKDIMMLRRPVRA